MQIGDWNRDGDIKTYASIKMHFSLWHQKSEDQHAEDSDANSRKWSCTIYKILTIIGVWVCAIVWKKRTALMQYLVEYSVQTPNVPNEHWYAQWIIYILHTVYIYIYLCNILGNFSAVLLISALSLSMFNWKYAATTISLYYPSYLQTFSSRPNKEASYVQD